MTVADVYEMREKGRELLLQTQGSDHYRAGGGVQPLELIASRRMLPDFAMGNVIKYATRHKVTQSPDDLKKIVDYACVLAGYYITEGVK